MFLEGTLVSTPEWNRFSLTVGIRMPLHDMSVQSCKSGRAFRAGPGFRPGLVGFGLKLAKMFRVDFGPAYKCFSQWRTRLSPTTVEAVELIMSSRKMIDCEWFSHNYFAAPPIPAAAPILTHAVNLAFRPQSGFRNKCRVRTSWKWGRLVYSSESVLRCVLLTYWYFGYYNVDEKNTNFKNENNWSKVLTR